MSLKQNLAVAFVIIILVATLMLTAYVATVHAAPGTITAAAQGDADDAGPSWERRPHDRSVPQ